MAVFWAGGRGGGVWDWLARMDIVIAGATQVPATRLCQAVTALRVLSLFTPWPSLVLAAVDG